MYIKDIELNNFRIYKGLNKISLLPSEDKKHCSCKWEEWFW
jgi:DNA sulfur modification protein DndD